MNTDHETLSRNLEDLKQKIAETRKVLLTLEVTFANRAEAAEEALDAYTNLLSSLELFPPLPAPFQDADLTLELNTAATNPQSFLAGADIKKLIKPTLSGIAEIKRSERASLEIEYIQVDNELDQLALECENVEEEIGEIERKVFALGEQAEDLRDVSDMCTLVGNFSKSSIEQAAQQEADVVNAEATRLERELARARTAALASRMDAKSRLQALQFELSSSFFSTPLYSPFFHSYNEKAEKISRLKEETVRAVMKNVKDIAMFKEEISRHLREFAEVS